MPTEDLVGTEKHSMKLIKKKGNALKKVGRDQSSEISDTRK